MVEEGFGSLNMKYSTQVRIHVAYPAQWYITTMGIPVCKPGGREWQENGLGVLEASENWLQVTSNTVKLG